jgi:hypothetical protein
MKLIDFLSGKKTYIIAVIIAVLNFAVAMGWLSVEMIDQINLILVSLGLGSLRAGISKVE